MLEDVKATSEPGKRKPSMSSSWQTELRSTKSMSLSAGVKGLDLILCALVLFGCSTIWGNFYRATQGDLENARWPNSFLTEVAEGVVLVSLTMHMADGLWRSGWS